MPAPDLVRAIGPPVPSAMTALTVAVLAVLDDVYERFGASARERVVVVSAGADRQGACCVSHEDAVHRQGLAAQIDGGGAAAADRTLVQRVDGGRSRAKRDVGRRSRALDDADIGIGAVGNGGPRTAPVHIDIGVVGDNIAAGGDHSEVRAADRGPITRDLGGIIYGSGRDAVRCTLGPAR